MKKISVLLAAVMFFGTGAVGAVAAPVHGTQAGRSTAIDLVQFDDGGRCYNRCIRGRAFHRCEMSNMEEGKASCCSRACNSFHNQYGR